MKQDEENNIFLPFFINELPRDVREKLDIGYFNRELELNLQEFIYKLIDLVSKKYNTITSNQTSIGGGTKKPDVLLSDILTYIANNKNTLFIIYKYVVFHNCFQEQDAILLDKINNFVERGILLED